MIFFCIVVGICIGDLALKYYIEKKDFSGKDITCMHEYFRIEKHHNKGVFLNCFENMPRLVMVGTGVLTGVLMIFYGILLTQKRKYLLKLGMSFIVGGAAGNFIDRIINGYVVDFIRFHKIKPISKIICNLADVFIFTGALFVLLASLFHKD